MNPRTALLAALIVIAGCASAPTATSDEAGEWVVSEDLAVKRLADGVWLHTSWRALEGGTRFPSNGLIVRDGGGVLLIDTAWGEEPTADLLRWIDETLRLPVTRAVITHHHDDRVGGAAMLLERNIPFHAHPLTGELASEDGFPKPASILDLGQPGGAVAMGPVEVFYPGPGHARDNLVVWIPSQRVLFGGCAVRAAGTNSPGNIADAVMEEWPISIDRVIDRYRAAAIVVPGHGDPGDFSLLPHTRKIVGVPAVK